MLDKQVGGLVPVVVVLAAVVSASSSVLPAEEAAVAAPAPVAAAPAAGPLLPAGWDAKQEADKVLARLVNVCEARVKGAHDSDFVILDGRAYVVYMANDRQSGEAANWPFIYDALSIVNLRTLAVEKVIPFAASGQAYANHTLAEGACFVPRILQKDARTLRCFFASENPGKRQAQTWRRDFDLRTGAFDARIHKARIKTPAGVFDMQPEAFYRAAAAEGFKNPPKDFGLYQIDSFKRFDGKTYCVLNNYPAGQNALASLDEACETFEVIGHFNEPQTFKLTEAAVERLPDGTWLAVCRQEAGSRNYTFTQSKDGRSWSPNEYRPVIPNGTSSKPTFHRFKGVYYLGWQESTRIKGVHRSVFNVEVSADATTWRRKYRFETEKSFQYPVFREHEGAIWLTVTQGDSSGSRKERIMFGRLE